MAEGKQGGLFTEVGKGVFKSTARVEEDHGKRNESGQSRTEVTKRKKKSTDSTTDHAAGDTPWRKLEKEEQKRTG